MKVELAESDRPPAFLTLEEYFSNYWGPDCDFVDGRSVDRNVGAFDHSCVVTALIWILSGKQLAPQRFLPLPSVRTRVSATRIRVPDVCVIERGGPRERILSSPPLAVIEVLDEEDRFSPMMEKLDDYWRFGVENIWLIDPKTRRAWTADRAGLHLVQNGELTVAGTPIRVVLSELFVELDR